jgi:hypothetical protein
VKIGAENSPSRERRHVRRLRALQRAGIDGVVQSRLAAVTRDGADELAPDSSVSPTIPRASDPLRR